LQQPLTGQVDEKAIRKQEYEKVKILLIHALMGRLHSFTN